MVYERYIREIPYKNFSKKSYCDSCGLSFDRRYMLRFSLRNTGIKVCGKCKQMLFDMIAKDINYYIDLAENIEMQYQITELMDTIQRLHNENKLLQKLSSSLLDMIGDKSR